MIFNTIKILLFRLYSYEAVWCYFAFFLNYSYMYLNHIFLS